MLLVCSELGKAFCLMGRKASDGMCCRNRFVDRFACQSPANHDASTRGRSLAVPHTAHRPRAELTLGHDVILPSWPSWAVRPRRMHTPTTPHAPPQTHVCRLFATILLQLGRLRRIRPFVPSKHPRDSGPATNTSLTHYQADKGGTHPPLWYWYPPSQMMMTCTACIASSPCTMRSALGVDHQRFVLHLHMDPPLLATILHAACSML